MKVAIAMASYNGERYISEQLDSILNQTFSNFEIVICDDKSTDSTRNILREYANKYRNIHVFYNEENLGFLKNFEKAIRVCEKLDCDYIALSDQDDIWEREHLQILLENIGKNYLCCGDLLFVNENNNSLNCRLSEIGNVDIFVLSDNKKRLLQSLCGSNFYQGASMLFRKDFCSFFLPFYDGPVLGWHDLWIVLVALVHNSFVYVPQVITRYRRHTDNVSSRNNFGYGIWIKPECASKLLEIFPNLQLDYVKILKETVSFSKNKNIMFFLKNYSIMYVTNSKRKLIQRFVGNFIVQPIKKYLSRKK